MPYLILYDADNGKFKVCKKSNPDECFSKQGIPLERAKRQVRAIGMYEAGAKPLNQDLYNQVKREVYEEMPKHSLYRSARIQKEYKERGGTYDDEPLPEMNIRKWFQQQWISLNDYLNDNIVPCGNSKVQDEYPLCRPLAIAQRLTKPQIEQMIEKKQELQNKPLRTSKITGNNTLNIKPTKTGLGKTKKQIKPLPRNLLLLIAKKVAKARGYNPDNLRLSKDKIHKLEYNDDGKWVKFGRMGYNDFPTYMYNYVLKNITYNEAISKMKNYRKRAMNIKGKWKDNKYSPNSLAISILW